MAGQATSHTTVINYFLGKVAVGRWNPVIHRFVRSGMSRIGVRAFSSEVDAGSRQENASKRESRASVLIQSEPIMLLERPTEIMRDLADHTAAEGQHANHEDH